MIRTQVYLTEALYREIQLSAKKEKKSQAHVIRHALERGLAKKRKQSVGDALLELTKIGARGPKDLSQNIDKYLYGE